MFFYFFFFFNFTHLFMSLLCVLFLLNKRLWRQKCLSSVTSGDELYNADLCTASSVAPWCMYGIVTPEHIIGCSGLIFPFFCWCCCCSSWWWLQHLVDIWPRMFILVVVDEKQTFGSGRACYLLLMTKHLFSVATVMLISSLNQWILIVGCV